MTRYGDVLLEARGLTFAYPGGVAVLDGWSAPFRAGSMTAITGPSGCGKSTLLYLLGLMLRPDGGQVVLDGRPVQELSDRCRADLRATVFGFVFQDAALDTTRSVLDNVIETALYRRQPRREASATARELLERFGVAARAEHRPGQISGGQAQRIALCRALLGTPRVVLADEPTGNLDHDSAEVVLDALTQHAATGATVVIVTHTTAIAAACDQQFALPVTTPSPTA